jgi:hypothetical protein
LSKAIARGATLAAGDRLPRTGPRKQSAVNITNQNWYFPVAEVLSCHAANAVICPAEVRESGPEECLRDEMEEGGGHVIAPFFV